MRGPKLIILLLLLVAFIGAKAQGSVAHHESKKSLLSEAKFSQKISGDDEDEESVAKRKRRPRGIAVGYPQITDILFDRAFTYTANDPVWITRSYSSFLFCVDRKRGPPLG